MPGPGEKLLEIFVALYTLRMIWNHGHRIESVGILIASIALQLWWTYPRK